MISLNLRPYLDDLEARIDPDQEERLLQEWRSFNQGAGPRPFFSPRRAERRPPVIPWPKVKVNAALQDFDAMAIQQFGTCSEALASGSGLVLNVRCNYGSSILPSLFGVEDYIMEDSLDTLPTSRPLNDEAAVQRLLDSAPPQLTAGWGDKVFAMGERFLEIARAYPKIGRYVYLYHPDLQGPLDACEVIWGSSMFYALYDCPERVHALLDRITDTYIRFLRAWSKIVPFRSGGSAHWGFLHAGTIMLRADSAMNLSAAMFEEFSRPYDQRLLDTFGGGAIHFCGRGDHFIDKMTAMQGVTAINVSQPELNDMETIFSCTVDRGINLLGLQKTAAQRAVESGRDLKGRVHIL